MKRYIFIFLAIIIGFDICWEIYCSDGGSFSAALSYLEPSEQKKAEETYMEISAFEEQSNINSNYTICIDPGHGIMMRSGNEIVRPGGNEKKNAFSEGQSGKTTTESALNLKYGLALRDELLLDGFNVVMTRDTEECDLSESDRAAIGNSADFIISLHCDGTDSGSDNGISLFYPKTSYSANDITLTSETVGKYVFNAATTATGAIRRASSAVDTEILFNYSKVPVFKIVYGSIENETDENRIISEKYLKNFVRGVVDGFSRYANANYEKQNQTSEISQ